MPSLSEFKRYIGVISLTLVYILVNMLFTLKGIYYLNALPIILFIVFIALVRLDYLFFIIIIFTPLSIILIEFIPSSPIDFAIPTEPMIFGVMLIVIIKMIFEKSLDLKILKHPVSYAIIFHLFWLLITTMTSTMPLVSFKFLLARFWFIITFYLLAIYIFRKTENISKFIWAYSIPMVIIIFYSINRHLAFGLFDKEAAHFVMSPFFRDHTSYGAVLAILFFAVGSLLFKSNQSLISKLFILFIFIIIIIGTILSYTRAAWIGIIFSFGILFITLLKVKFRYVAFIGTIIIVLFISQKDSIIYSLERNKQESSADLAEHVRSISNIKSDNSNIERLNRWDCAFSMFKERPVFGWGPGTYMFQYAPFQITSNMTYVSTDFGDFGNAHSEYIGPLSESGFLGTISFILIAITSLITGFKVYRKIDDKSLKYITLGLILGFITYLLHGILNNFLDTDKVSALFWGYIAVFVSLDIFYLPQQNKQAKAENAIDK
jgi:putative inorganic carbon (hco3(-)) transporter